MCQNFFPRRWGGVWRRKPQLCGAFFFLGRPTGDNGLKSSEVKSVRQFPEMINSAAAIKFLYSIEVVLVA